MPYSTVDDRFWSKVDKSGECWTWTASTNPKGYGWFGYGGKLQLAHRVSWQLAYGPIIGELNVLHSCDNPPCVRPDHLFLGTNGDNNADRHAKGRSAGPRGEKNGATRLTANDVAYIRSLRGQVKQKDLAMYYGMTQAGISHVQTGRSWA